jgi:hypothetical protein
LFLMMIYQWFLQTIEESYKLQYMVYSW